MKSSILSKKLLLKKAIRSAIKEALQPIAGDAPGEKQVHLFDFDDTLGVTSNANAIMLYQDGQPLHRSEGDAKKWISGLGLTDKDLLPPKIVQIPERDGAYAIYVTSSGLAKVQSKYNKNDQKVTGFSEPDKGEQILIDFTPSSSTDIETTKPIKQTIEKLKSANAIGARTAVVTARSAEGDVQDIHGNKLKATNAKDMEEFLAKQGAAPTDGVFGVSGGDKGGKIKKYFVDDSPEKPEEIHFYDDLSKNTSDVKNAMAEKIPAELFIYGPGEFDHGEANAEEPAEAFPPAEDEEKQKLESINHHRKNNSMMIERWQKLAGIIK